jgi:hypothetical protein
MFLNINNLTRIVKITIKNDINLRVCYGRSQKQDYGANLLWKNIY